jgi:hypothetical protein
MPRASPLSAAPCALGSERDDVSGTRLHSNNSRERPGLGLNLPGSATPAFVAGSRGHICVIQIAAAATPKRPSKNLTSRY